MLGQTGLPDSGLTCDQDQTAASGSGAGGRSAQLAQGLLTADQDRV
jgi:hypothetical protein